MLSGPRSCIGKKLNSLPAACANSLTTVEPLLFLYPKWFRAAVQHPVRAETGRGRRFATNSRKSGLAATGLADTPNEAQETFKSSGQYKEKEEQAYRCSVSDFDRRESSVGASCALPQTWATDLWRPFNEHVRGEARSQNLRRTKVILSRKTDTTSCMARASHNGHLGKKIAKTLAQIKPRGINDQTVIFLDAEFLQFETGTSDENSWRHNDGSGCIVRVCQPEQDRTRNRKVILTGSMRAREIASQYLLRLQQQYCHLEHDARLEQEDAKPIRNSKIHVRVDQISKPSIWTLKSFSNHIKTIVDSQLPKSIERQLYPNNDTFNKSAAKALIEIFSDPELTSFQSSFALRLALDFCSVKTDIGFAASSIWSAARRAGYVPDVACFNHEISRCLRIGKVGTIERLALEMHYAHVQPNGDTWSYVFELLQNAADRNWFLQLPAVQDMNRGQTSQELMIQAIIEADFHPSDTDQDCVFNFHQRMQSAYGTNWLAPSTVRQMLKRCNAVYAPRTVSQVLRLVAHMSVKLDPVSFTTLLKGIAETHWFEDILLLLTMQPSTSDFLLNQQQTEIVFREAWRLRLVNTCRVLWHYAASHGAIRHSMLIKVSGEITQNAENRYTALMAALIIGTDRCVSRPRHALETSGAKLVSDAIASLKTWTPAGEARHNQMQVAHLLIERDLTAWRRFEPMTYETLLRLLNTGFEMDKSWETKEIMSEMSLSALMKEAISISLVSTSVSSELSEVKKSASDHDTRTKSLPTLCIKARPHEPNSNTFNRVRGIPT